MRHLLIYVLLLLCLIQGVHAQDNPLKKRVTLQYERITLPDLFTEIKKNYRVSFSYAHDLVSSRKKIKVTIINLPLDEALKNILETQGLAYEVIGKQVVVKRGIYPRSTKQSSLSTPIMAIDKEEKPKPIEPIESLETMMPIASTDFHGPYVEEIIEPLPISAPKARNVLMEDEREVKKQLKQEVRALKDTLAKLNDPIEKSLLQRRINRFVEGIETRLIQIKDSIKSIKSKESVQKMGSSLQASIQQVRESMETEADSIPRKRRMFERSPGDTSTAADGLEVHPAQLTAVFPIGTSWIYSTKYRNTVSINVFVGLNGGVKGVELGCVNIIKKNVAGVQLGAFTNIVAGNLEGVQGNGFFNFVRGQARGVQAAGYFNMAGSSSQVAQGAAYLNIVNGDNAGFQASGFTNITKGDVIGFQATGFVNICTKELSGFQVAGFANISKGNVYGFQVAGILNIAKKIHGTQIALINICDSVSKGTPIGLINIVKKNGYYRGEVWANEIFFINGSFKIGTEKLYAIVTLGVRPQSNFRYGSGFGIGSHFKIGPTYGINVDLTTFSNITDLPTDKEDNNIQRLQVTLSRKLFGGISFFIGPSINLLVSQRWQENSYNAAPSWSFYKTSNTSNDTTKFNLWIGLSGGIRF